MMREQARSRLPVGGGRSAGGGGAAWTQPGGAHANPDCVSLSAEEEAGDLVQPGVSFPGPEEDDLGRVRPAWPCTLAPSPQPPVGTARRSLRTFPLTRSRMCVTSECPNEE